MKVLIIGDYIIDKYLYGTCDRLSPEAPTPILKVTDVEYRNGGAGNVAANLKALGVDVVLFTIFGQENDLRGIALKLLDQIPHCPITVDRKFTVKTRLIAQNQQLARYDNEDIFELSQADVDKIINMFKKYCEDFKIEAVILSDYGKGMISSYFLQRFKEIVKLLHLKVFVDPKQEISNYVDFFAITPNLKELNNLFKTNFKNIIDLEKNKDHLVRLLKLYNIQNIIITLGADGAFLINESTSMHFKAEKISVFDVTGAGDTFLAALVFDYLRNKDLHNAISFANVAASLSVQKIGTAVVTLSEIQQHFSKIFDMPSLQLHVEHLKTLKKKVVFTNGCFDILHPGHLHLIKTAKIYGDYLIVAINSDKSVKKLKGDKRPIFSQDQRANLLASITEIDAVIIFDEETPFEILQTLRPTILVKGADYKLEDVIGKEFVEQTVLVELKTEYSTTKTIEKITNPLDEAFEKINQSTGEELDEIVKIIETYSKPKRKYTKRAKTT